MPIKISCPSCHKALKADERFAGKTTRCPRCQTEITIPKPVTDADHSEKLVPKPVVRPKKPAPPQAEEPDAAEDFSDFDDETDSYGLAHPKASDSDDDEYQPRRSKPKKVAAVRTRHVEMNQQPTAADNEPSWRKHLHWLLAVALVPLALSMFWKDEATFAERLDKTVQAHPEVLPKLQQLPESADLNALFDVLPNNCLEGAHLSRRSWMHWLYALLSIGGFLALLMLMLPGGSVSPSRLLFTGIITGTVGIFLLLGFQWVAMYTQGFNVRGRGLLVVLFYIVKFIGFSYRCALEEGNGFLLSFMGFTCGVGLCEEVCKAVPIAIYLRSTRNANWKGACVVGLASGIGFGVSEGLTYSSDFYNGISGIGIYLVRFISCVALHSLWSGCVAQLMFNNQDNISEVDGENIVGFVVHYLLIAMILHGLYDTLLKQQQPLWALAIAAASFGWFVFMMSRQADSD